jgi:hypothetical protein
MLSDLTKLTIPQIATVGGVLVAIIASLALALKYVLGDRRFRVKAGSTVTTLGAGCDCTMRGIIMSTHRLTLAHTDALDVLLVAINGKGNGEVAAVRTNLQKAKTHHVEEMADLAAAGGEK